MHFISFDLFFLFECESGLLSFLDWKKNEEKKEWLSIRRKIQTGNDRECWYAIASLLLITKWQIEYFINKGEQRYLQHDYAEKR